MHDYFSEEMSQHGSQAMDIPCSRSQGHAVALLLARRLAVSYFDGHIWAEKVEMEREAQV